LANRSYPSRATTVPGSASYYETLLENPNVQRGLSVIRSAEGTARRADPYSVGYGFSHIRDLSWHPGTSKSFTANGRRQKTTAAGAYQFLKGTWNSVASKLGLTNFGPRAQDIAALALIDGRNGLNALVNGDLRGFINAVGPEWASLPSAPKEYGQPTKSWGEIQRAWDMAGVDLAGAPLPPQRFQTVSARAVAPNAQSMRLAATLGALPAGGRTQLPAQTFAAPLGKIERAPLQPVGPLSRNQVAAYQDYANTRGYAPVDPVPARPAAPVNSMNNIPRGNLAPPAAPALSPKQVNAYQQYAQSRIAAPLTPPPSAGLLTSSVPISPAQTFGPKPTMPTFVPASPVPTAPPPAVPQPAPMQVQRLPSPVQEFPAAPPAPRQPTAMDVYNGQAARGVASDGSIVSADQFGRTTVENKFGARTTTLPNGSQAASFGSPGVSGPLDGQGVQSPGFGISQPQSRMGEMVRGGLGGMAGSALGGMLGPIGAIAGGLIGAELAKGRNPLDALGIGTFNRNVMTPYGMMNMTFANPQRGGAFPNAPTGTRGALGGRESNLTDRQMREISPRAADAISKGQGGLY